MPRLKREDWFAATIPILKEKGIDGVTIESLCLSVERSKGSFYHHFKDIISFQKDFLDWWYNVYTEFVIEEVEQESTPADKMKHLEGAASNAEFDVEIAIRVWAYFSDLADEYIKRVDNRRLNYLVGIYNEFVIEENLAHDLASYDYAAFIGFLMLGYYTPIKSLQKLLDYNNMFNEAMLRLVQHKKLFRPGVDLGKWTEILNS